MAGATYRSGDGRLPHEGSGQVPEGAWVDRADGTTVELVLAPDEGVDCWVASPPEGVSAVMVQRGDRLRTRQWPGQSIRFDRVWSAAGDELVLEQEDQRGPNA